MRLTIKGRLISNYIQEWLRANNETEAKPKDVIDYLVEKNLYKNNALRNFQRDLRILEKRKMINFIKGIEAKQVKTKRFWVLKKVD
jgi:protease II